MRQLPAIDSRSWKQKRGISAPAASQACNSVYSGGTSSSLPSMMTLVMPLLRRHCCGLAHAMTVGARRIFIDAPLDLGPEMPDQALDRPGCGIAERTDRVAFHLRRDLQQHVDLALLRAAFRHAGEHAP